MVIKDWENLSNAFGMKKNDSDKRSDSRPSLQTQVFSRIMKKASKMMINKIFCRIFLDSVQVFESRNNDESDIRNDEPLQRYRRVEIQKPRLCNYSVTPLFTLCARKKDGATMQKEDVDVDIPFVLQRHGRSWSSWSVNRSIQNSCTGFLLTYMLDLAVANAWRLHALTGGVKLDQLQFRLSIARP